MSVCLFVCVSVSVCPCVGVCVCVCVSFVVFGCCLCLRLCMCPYTDVISRLVYTQQSHLNVSAHIQLATPTSYIEEQAYESRSKTQCHL